MTFGIGAGVVGAVAGVGSAVIGANASKKASASAAASNQASIDASAQATQDRLDFDKQVYADSAEGRAFAAQQAKQMGLWQAEDRTKYNWLQDDQIARGKAFQDAESGMLQDAIGYDTEGNRERMAGQAMADVNQAFNNTEGQMRRSLSRSGVNPSSGMALAMRRQSEADKALAMVSATTKARNLAETTGYARKMDAVGLGKGIIGNQATQATLALNAGNSSVTNGTNSVVAATSGNAAMSQGYGNAAAGFNTLANTQGNNFYAAQRYGSNVGTSVGNAVGGFVQANRGLWSTTPVDPMAGYSYGGTTDASGQFTPSRAGM